MELKKIQTESALLGKRSRKTVNKKEKNSNIDNNKDKNRKENTSKEVDKK